MVRDILDGSAMLQPHKASVLAALAITDQLFRLQRENAAFREEATRRAAGLSAEISRRLEARGLATRS
jgi:cell division protein ZapA (FtsZ GTPase activity inhibitor)